MDIIPIAGMLFSLLMVLVIGGLILLFPISRRLGKFLEIRIDERMEWNTLPKESLNELVDIVEELQTEVKRLSDRQQFVERLLEPGRPEEPARPGQAPKSEEGRAGSGGTSAGTGE
ncbi:MAG: hypothetical protein R3314_02115 [Longimicrobiales bacterium]|nr:hypothetical protein [Longimicrobiales bacterium]